VLLLALWIKVNSVTFGMSEKQVHRLLGPPEGRSFSLTSTQDDYPKLGIQIFWSTPGYVIAPAEQIGPGGMNVLQAMPWPWVRGVIVPLLSLDYWPPVKLQGVKWVGFRP
jgi:hypothetical protein